VTDPTPADPALAPEVAGLAFLLGTWTGAGRGVYPTIEPFEYTEEARFGHAGRPLLTYAQRTVRRDTGLPAHAETGFLRPAPGGGVELVLAHSFGVVEVTEGTVDGTRLALRSTSVRGTATAKEIVTIERRIEVDGDTLRYTIDMAAVGQPLQRHLTAELHRI
jgi:hypothetical protein